MRELFDVQPEFISLVEEGANRKKFKIFKSADSKEAGGQGSRYQELAEKFYKESFIGRFKEYMKDWFDGLRKTQVEIDNEEKGGRTMDKEKEKELEKQKKAKAEEDRIKAEKAAKEKQEKEKIEKEAMKVRVAEAVASILQEKENLEELKGLIAKVEKGEEVNLEEIAKLKKALGMKEEEVPEEEKAKKIEKLEARVKELERGRRKSIEGQEGEPKERKWKSITG